MDAPNDPYLTTRELADLLRIKERKVYDLAAGGEVPCVRVVGKLLFPRAEVLAWIAAARSGPAAMAQLPRVVLGSSDPLLDWALRESGSGLAGFFDGSQDGLSRFAAHEGVACGLHMHEAEGWNRETVRAQMGAAPVVLVEFAQRSRGLIVAPGNPLGLGDMAGLQNVRLARRQPAAASQAMLDGLLNAAGIDPAQIAGPQTIARTEADLAQTVFEGEADAAFGLCAAARAMRLDFVPVLEERFDLLVWRHAWFEPPFQKLLSFLQTSTFAAKADTLGGYDVSGLGRVWLNGAA